tara:strand:- start:447 stop:1292 length:846 start_codon:yes stop_codon:yes gene_type:complete
MSIQDITIVITSFKSDERLRNCLRSINRQCNVIIVENSKNQDIKEKIEKEFSNVKLILTGENLGYGKANNLGLKYVKTKYALILNPDTTLLDTSLENFIKAANELKEFAIMAPYVQERGINEKKTNLKSLLPKSVESVKGFAMFLNLFEFKDIGFFDEVFFLYFEDIDLCRRVKQKNKKIYLIPSVEINHLGGKSSHESISDERELTRNWHWMWSSFTYHKKYKGFIIALSIVFPKLISSIFKMIVYFLLMNKKKRNVYYHRFSGLMNGIIGRNSWHRPKV